MRAAPDLDNTDDVDDVDVDVDDVDDLNDRLADGPVVDVVRDVVAAGTLELLLRAATPEFVDEVTVALVDVLGLKQACAQLHTTTWSTVDVEAVVARDQRNASIRQAIEQSTAGQGRGLADVIAALEASSCSDDDRATWWPMVARHFDLDSHLDRPVLATGSSPRAAASCATRPRRSARVYVASG